jgi:L-aminopeptidase/D-esterase-like protein
MTSRWRVGGHLLFLAATVTLAIPEPELAQAAQAGNAGTRNDITDVQGVSVGTYSPAGGHTGSTVLYFNQRGTGGYDVRGGAPITRETDLLDPVNEVQHANAVLLTGGGDYGLAAGPGVMQNLYSQGIGFPVGLTDNSQVVPIVPGAAINDLGRGAPFSSRPDFNYGVQASAAATGQTTPSAVAAGNVGAGVGAVAGGLKGGVGSASQVIAGQGLPQGMVVAAYVVVDSVGSPVDTVNGCTLIGTRMGLAGEFNVVPPPHGCDGYQAPQAPGVSTVSRGGVIGVVATNVTLDKTFSKKFASAGQDGLLLGVSPTHTMFDSDVMFGISTGFVTPGAGVIPDCVHAEVSDGTILGPGTACLLLLNMLLQAASDTVSRAVAHAMLSATSVPGVALSYCDRFAGACPASASSGAAAHSAPTVPGARPRATLPQPTIRPPALPSPPSLGISPPALSRFALLLLLLGWLGFAGFTARRGGAGYGVARA